MMTNSRVPLAVWMLSGLALLGFAVLAFLRPFSLPLNTYFTDVLIILVAGLATWFVYRIVRQFDAVEKPRRVWRYFGAGLAVWTVGELLWFLYSLFSGEPSSLSLGDVAWLVGYPLLGMALLLQYRLLLNPQVRRERFWIALAWIALFLFAAVLSWLMPGPSDVETFINFFYPVGDLALAAGALWLARQFGSGAWGRPWQALLIFTIADALYAWVTGMGLYESHLLARALTDTLYFFAYIVLAVACYIQYRLVKRA